ncbi:MAG: hypothetical protein JSS61_00225 [Verrucomicrobia bacterium]|nr:hypothetical protein [Verrucomicrobiota bacterium]
MVVSKPFPKRRFGLFSPSFSEEEKQTHRRTWEIFEKALQETIGQEKIDWIQKRYQSHANFKALRLSGSPLLPEHIEMFSAGIAQVRKKDIFYVKEMTRAQIAAEIERKQVLPLIGAYTEPETVLGTPTTMSAHFLHDTFDIDKQKQILFSDAAKISFEAWADRMAKVTVNKELIKGQLLPVRGTDGQIDYYKVHCKIDKGQGLVAYALKPAASDSTLRPLLVFRPTQFSLSGQGAIPAFLNNCQPRIGMFGWLGAQAEFQALMKDPDFKQIDLIGYSLGGVHAQRFLAEHHQHVRHVRFYADPSLEAGVTEKFAEEINRMPRRKEPLHIQIFQVEGDPCPHAGEKHLGWGITHPDVIIQLFHITVSNHKEWDRTYLHAFRPFDSRGVEYSVKVHDKPDELSLLLNNPKRSEEAAYYSYLHSKWSPVVSAFFTALEKLLYFFSWVTGLPILR